MLKIFYKIAIALLVGSLVVILKNDKSLLITSWIKRWVNIDTISIDLIISDHLIMQMRVGGGNRLYNDTIFL